MSKTTRQVARHNVGMRNVCYEYSYKFKEFLEKSGGNILINGGLKSKRRACLLEYITYVSQTTTRPIVVFSDDDILEDSLISFAQGGRIGSLKVCSENYSKYDFFCGMQNRFISECLTRIASVRGCRDTMEAQNYINAFLSIMREKLSGSGSSRKGPDLNSMLEGASYSDTKIAESSSDFLNSSVIESSPKGGVLFRSMLQVFAEETEEIRNKNSGDFKSDADGVTVKNCVESGSIILVKAPAVNCEIFSVYFAAELRSLIDKDFVCIFDDSFMLDTEAMQTVVNMLKKRPNIDVVVSCDNIVAFEEVCDRSITVNFNCNLIFLNGNVPQQDLQKMLSSFGQYTHMDVVNGRTTPPRLLMTLERGESESAQSYTRDRILLQEECDKEAVITYGSDANIVIVESLINSN